MAEYYPLLSKAVGSLPNSTPDTRRIVYERARKALIGQLRTMHPPIPDEDIERESVALDRAVERLESELANGAAAGPTPAVPLPTAAETTAVTAKPAVPGPAAARPQDGSTKPANGTSKTPTGKKPDLAKPKAKPATPPAAPPSVAAAVPPDSGALGPAEPRPTPPMRTKPLFEKKGGTEKPQSPAAPSAQISEPIPAVPVPVRVDAGALETVGSDLDTREISDPEATADALRTDMPKSEAPLADAPKLRPPRSDGQRPIAPQPPSAAGPKRRLWIIPAGVGIVVVLVALAAWKLRDHPETIAKKPVDTIQADSGKIAERVGGPGQSDDKSTTPQTQPDQAAPVDQPTAADKGPSPQAQPTPAPGNPELPVAHRAALLVEAPDEPNKVKTFLGTVVWKLNNVPQGPNDAVGLAVEADIDLPDDKLKAVVTFEKNTDPSLAASHTIKVRFSVEPGSFSGDVKQISTPQMRPEASPSGDALAGVTVPIVANSFLVGLSPGNAEAANTDLIRRLQWVDIPMLLDNGKIAKLTFEKSDSGQRDLNEAFAAWAK